MLDLEEMARTHNDCLEVCGECGLSTQLGDALLWAIDRIRQLEDEQWRAPLFVMPRSTGKSNMAAEILQERMGPNPLHPDTCPHCHKG